MTEQFRPVPRAPAMTPQPTQYCWMPGPLDPADDMPMTCVLPRDHAGLCEWTRDNEITFAFSDTPPEEA